LLAATGLLRTSRINYVSDIFYGVSGDMSCYKMPISRLFEKAKKLVESHRVEALGQGVYNVIGDHGTYIVAQDYTGKWSCTCPGFMSKGKCSHIVAVMLLTKMKKRRKPKKS
jgi:predicted nucleic acid-binding Zn finger protein